LLHHQSAQHQPTQSREILRHRYEGPMSVWYCTWYQHWYQRPYRAIMTWGNTSLVETWGNTRYIPTLY
jgi:hypothetical protein